MIKYYSAIIADKKHNLSDYSQFIEVDENTSLEREITKLKEILGKEYFIREIYYLGDSESCA